MKTRLFKPFAVLLFTFFCFAGKSVFAAPTTTISLQTGGLLSGTITPGQSGAFIGFSVQVSGGSVTFTQFNISSNVDASTYFANGKLYRSATSTYSAASPGTLVGTVTLSNGAITVNTTGETVNNTTQYYFFVADDIYSGTSVNSSVQVYINSATFAKDSNNATYPAYLTYQQYTFNPTTIAVSNLTGGLAASSLIQGQTNKAVFGFSVAVTGLSTLSQMSISTNNANLNGYFTNYKLYRNTSNSYGTGTATAIGTATVSGSSINITGLTEAFKSTAAGQTNTNYYFLAVDYTASTGTLPGALQCNFTSGQSTAALTQSYPNSSTFNTFSVTGNSFTMNSAAVAVSSQQNGLASATVYPGQTGLAVFGFGVSATTGSATITQMNINSDNSSLSTYYGNAKLYRSTTSNYTTGTRTLVGTASISGGFVSVTGLSEAISTTEKYYFLVVDATYSGTSTNATTFKFVSAQSSAALVQTTPSTNYNTFDITGTTFNITQPTVTSAQITGGLTGTTLTYGQTGAAVLGFSISVTGNATVTQVNFAADGNTNTLQTLFTAKLYRSATSTYNASSPGTQVGTVTLNGTSVSITGLTEAFTSGQTNNYFLVVSDIYSSYTTADAARFYINSATAITTSTGATFSAYSNYGSSYTLTTRTVGYTVTSANASSNGITQGSLTNSQTGIVLFGFGISSDANATVSGFNVYDNNTGGQPQAYFTNGKIYRSTSSTFSTGTATLLSATISFGYNAATGIAISGLSESLTANASPVYYFIVSDCLSAFNDQVPTTHQFQFLTTQTNPVVQSSPSSGNVTVGNNINGTVFSLVKSYFWNGSSDKYWNNSNNWTGSNVPPNDGTANVDIPNVTNSPTSQYSQYDTDNGSGVTINLKSLKIEANAKLTMVKSYSLQIGSGGMSGTGTLDFNVAADGNYPYTAGVDGNNTVTIASGATSTIGNITLNKGAKATTVTLASGNGNLGVTGVITVNKGTLAVNSNTLTLKSTATATAAVAAITPSNAVITGNVNVERFITGAASAYRGYRLLSSPVNISSNTTGGGNISLAYINTTPTGSTTYGALTGGPGGTSNGFTITSPNPTLYLYNETITSSNATYTAGKNVGVAVVGSTTISTLSNGVTTPNISLPVGNGYLMYFIGNNQSMATAASRVPENTTITAVGSLNQGDIPVRLWFNGSTNFSLSYNNTVNTTLKAGYNLVGNPYASSIDLAAVYSGNSSAYPIFCVLDNVNPSQQYLSYNASNGAKSSSHVTQYVASGQGFFVKATGTGQTLTFKEAQKASTVQFTSGTTLLESTPKSQQLTVESMNSGASSPSIGGAQTLMASGNQATLSVASKLKSLHLKIYQDNLTEDECGIYFGSGYSDKLDAADAVDLDGVAPKVYISSYSSDNVRTSINMMADYTKNKLVKLFVYATTDGLYHLQMTDLANVDTVHYNVFLLDRYKKDSLDMRRYKTYNFNIIKSDTTSFGANRFVLAIERIEPANPYKFVSVSAAKATKGVAIKWRTLYEQNYIHFVVEKQTSVAGKYTALYDLQSNASTNYTYTDLNPAKGANVYRVKQTDIYGEVTYSSLVSVTYSQTVTSTNATSLFSVYPNPVVESIKVSVTEVDAKSPSYKLNIYNTSGLLMMQKTSNEDSFSENVADFQPGIYVVELQSNDGKPLGKTKFVKVK